jgi:hypothetical protein
MIKTIEFLNWDSSFFSKQIISIRLNENGFDLIEIINIMKEMRADLSYVFTPKPLGCFNYDDSFVGSINLMDEKTDYEKT